MELPEELIQHIFSFLNPCDIVRSLRQVSKQFHDITQDAALWREVYANARLLLPPGLFSWQSTQYLERTLVKSELVSKTWTSQPFEMHTSTLRTWQGGRFASWAIAFGRWCIFLELEGKTVRCYDIDTNSLRSLYDGTAHPSFMCVVYTANARDVDGRWVCLLLLGNLNIDGLQPPEWLKLLKFRVNDDGFSEPEIMNLTHIGWIAVCPMSSTGNFNGSVPFIAFKAMFSPQPGVVIDLRTSRVHRLSLPMFSSNYLTNPSQDYLSYSISQIILTKTHAIAVQMPLGLRDAPLLVQAFAVPGSAVLRDEREVGEFRLTHEIAMSRGSFGLLRDSIVDPVTESVNIRLLHITTPGWPYSQEHHMLCLDLTLPKPTSTTDVLPIFIRSQHLFESWWTCELYTASDDGYVRGLLLTTPVHPSLREVGARKFTIDASEEVCTVVVGDPCPDVDISNNRVAFDGARGRILCHRYCL
ncbi:hypothetical protein V8E55_003506 [Tylopilus felleus]